MEVIERGVGAEAGEGQTEGENRVHTHEDSTPSRGRGGGLVPPDNVSRTVVTVRSQTRRRGAGGPRVGTRGLGDASAMPLLASQDPVGDVQTVHEIVKHGFLKAE